MTTQAHTKARTFEWWMFSNFAQGAGFSAFVSLLIPPFVTDVTGQASEAGVVMAIISLGAVLAPVLGGFADRYNAHRSVLVGSVGAMALAFVAYALSADQSSLFALDAILMGVSIAGMAAVGPVFIVGARLPQAVEAKQMTVFSLMMPAGQVVAGALLTATAAAGWTFSARFWLGAGFTGVCFLVVLLTSGAPGERLKAAMSTRVETNKTETRTGLRAVFLSTFGVFLLVIMLSSVANNGINNQISNILPNVFGINEATTSGLISLAGLLNIVLFFPAGAWMAKRGTFSPLAAGTVARFVAALGLAAAGALTQSPVLLVAALVQILYQSNPFVRLSQPGAGVRYASFPAGAASGWVIAASAVGSFIGSALGGFLADSAGFNSINIMAAIAGGLSVLVLMFGLWPAERRMRGRDVANVSGTSPPPSNA